MTAFDDLFAPAAEQLKTVFGEDAIYTPASGQAVALTGTLWSPISADMMPHRDGETVIEVFEVMVPLAQVTAPEMYATVARGTFSYVVEKVLQVPGAQWKFTVIRSLPQEKAHEGYRLRR